MIYRPERGKGGMEKTRENIIKLPYCKVMTRNSCYPFQRIHLYYIERTVLSLKSRIAFYGHTITACEVLIIAGRNHMLQFVII